MLDSICPTLAVVLAKLTTVFTGALAGCPVVLSINPTVTELYVWPSENKVVGAKVTLKELGAGPKDNNGKVEEADAGTLCSNFGCSRQICGGNVYRDFRVSRCNFAWHRADLHRCIVG